MKQLVAQAEAQQAPLLPAVAEAQQAPLQLAVSESTDTSMDIVQGQAEPDVAEDDG
jgi:hypothetical protein